MSAPFWARFEFALQTRRDGQEQVRPSARFEFALQTRRRRGVVRALKEVPRRSPDRRLGFGAASFLCAEAKSQRVQADEAGGVALLVGAVVVLERGNALVVQAVGIR